MQFWRSVLQQLKVENAILIIFIIFIWQEGTIRRAFQTVLAAQEVRFLIISYEKLYRKQPVEFLITEHIFLENQTRVS